MKLCEIINNYSACGRMNFLKGCPLEELKYFELTNGVNLPNGYKEWLQFSDGGELFLPAGVQLYGIKQKPMIDISDDFKPTNEYIVIGALASGDTILANQYSEKIAIFNIQDNKIELDEVYDCFKLFLLDLPNILGEFGDEICKEDI